MYPHERSLVKQLSGLPFEIVGVNSDDDLDQLKEVLKKENITWRSFQNAREGKDSIADEWVVQGWPTIYVIDQKGVIRFKDVRGEELDKAITELLAEMGHEVEISHDEEGEDGENP